MISPHEEAPTLDNQQICAFEQKTFGPGETRDLDCDSTGRYLSVILDQSHNQYLTLCEVEVFEGEIFMRMFKYVTLANICPLFLFAFLPPPRF